MDRSPKLREIIIPQDCRLVASGRYLDNREQYMAQSRLTVYGVVPELPTLEEARKINKGEDYERGVLQINSSNDD